MCFINCKKQLDRFRARKRAITAWKNGDIDCATGIVVTEGDGGDPKKRTEWRKGEEIQPHRIRQPLRDGHRPGAGLYFNTRKNCANCFGDAVVKAKIQPEDIIAVDECGETICCVKATVVDAPNPDQRLMRIKYLRKIMHSSADACKELQLKQNKLKQKQDEQQEVMECMKTELKALTL